MTLAAAVTWIRAGKGTAALDRLFIYCLRMVHCPTLEQKSAEIDYTAVWEDAAVGLIAIAARLATAIWRTITLSVDGQTRAPVAQIVASVLSLAQWALRYFVLDRGCEAPLTKLGGSTALVDATTAVMLGFSQAPLFVSSINRFDPTARLLTALLITTMTIHRCLFATACVGLLYGVSTDDASQKGSRFSREYVAIVLFALVAWLLQAASVAILLADVFAVPLAHSISRGYAGGWLEVAVAVYMGISAVGLPQLLRTVQHVAEEPIGRRAEK
jgi:hypothetical protein